jgi:hypothetical protein
MIKARSPASNSHSVSGGLYSFRDTEDVYSESVSLDLSLSYRWVEGCVHRGSDSLRNVNFSFLNEIVQTSSYFDYKSNRMLYHGRYSIRRRLVAQVALVYTVLLCNGGS